MIMKNCSVEQKGLKDFIQNIFHFGHNVAGIVTKSKPVSFVHINKLNINAFM